MLTATKGYYDGNTVIFDEKPAARSGSRVIVTFLQDESQEKAAAFDGSEKRSALKRLKNMDFSLREDFDADKALEEAMREKYGFVS
ncbi:MAG: hypothetical protein NC219_10585 [Prevotella sp.]|nr:hypothetical protein [Prevotella sp.]